MGAESEWTAGGNHTWDRDATGVRNRGYDSAGQPPGLHRHHRLDLVSAGTHREGGEMGARSECVAGGIHVWDRMQQGLGTDRDARSVKVEPGARVNADLSRCSLAPIPLSASQPHASAFEWLTLVQFLTLGLGGT